MIGYRALEDVPSLIENLRMGPIRGIGLLDSAVHRPQVSVFGDDAYPGVDDKAAVVLESLVRNHALVDGNERIGRPATVVFYGLNDITLEASDGEPTTWLSHSPPAPSPTSERPNSSRIGTSRQRQKRMIRIGPTVPQGSLPGGDRLLA